MPVRYREAVLADIPEMARIRHVGAWAGGADETVMHRYLAGDHHPRQALPPRVGLLAMEGDRVVGFIAGHRTCRFDCDGELQWIFVLPERRGAGIADGLLRELAHWFIAHDARRICVNVEPSNGRARAFYVRHGARELGEYWLEWRDIALAAEANVAPAV